MKRFRFPLQILCTLREQKEQAALKRYAHTLLAAQEAAGRVAASQHEIDSCGGLLQELLQAGTAADQVGRVRAYTQFLQERHVELDRAHREADQCAERAWHEFRAAMRDREALDKYREKQRRAYALDVQREEQKQLDEMAGRRPSLAEAFPL